MSQNPDAFVGTVEAVAMSGAEGIVVATVEAPPVAVAALDSYYSKLEAVGQGPRHGAFVVGSKTLSEGI